VPLELSIGFVPGREIAPEDCEVGDEDAWVIANPALHDFLYVDALRSKMRTTREPISAGIGSGSGPSMPTRGCPVRHGWRVDARPIRDDAEVVLGFDGSYSGDATAIVVVELGDVPHLDVVRVWELAVAAVMAFAAASTTEPGPQLFLFD
jgi:hypothetical protein